MNDKIYKFSFSCVSHLFKLERTNTDIHTISWVSYSVGHKICFQILNEATFRTCFVPKQNHLILLCYWTHHVIHEINTLAFSSNSKTRFIFTFILYFYDSLTVVCCIWREWRHWLWDCVGTSTRCRRRHGRRSWGWDVGRDVVSSTSCSGVSCSYAISTINFSSFFGQSREKLVGALVGWL